MLEGLRSAGVAIEEVGQREFESAAETDTPQGVLAIAAVPTRQLQDLPQTDRLRILVLDAVQDPGNVGTMLRTALAFGVTATFSLPGTVDLWNAKVVRSGMGAHFRHPCISGTWNELDAFRRAAARPRRHLTLVHKTNVLIHSGSLWSRTVEEVAREYSDVAVTYQHVDAASMFFVTDPGRFDVVVTDNLFGDILTDLGAAISGGIGLAASGNLDVSGRNPSMFEPVHGSAPDIARTGTADPTATVLSVALLLDHLGHGDDARRIEAAVAFDLATRNHTSPGRTQAIGDRLAALASGTPEQLAHRAAEAGHQGG